MLQLFLLFTLMPLLELWLLFQLSDAFGFFTTISIVLMTGVVGASLARWQGWQTIARIQNEMQQGIMPAKALGDGAMILVAGVLLITPGVITDVVGLSLLIPPVRAMMRKLATMWIAKNVQVQTNVQWQSSSSAANRTNGKVVEGQIVDAHVVENDDDS